MTTDVEFSWQLDCAETRHAESGGSFEIPPLFVRTQLFEGCGVKLIFLIRTRDGDVQGERMWVEITGRHGEGYAGKLLNQPRTPSSLRMGDLVVFEPRHICDAQLPEGA